MDDLIIAHIHLPKKLARKLRRKYSTKYHIDDMISHGNLGLISAARTYDKFKGKMTFVSYACFKINFHILDGARINGLFSRCAYAKGLTDYEILGTLIEPNTCSIRPDVNRSLDRGCLDEQLSRLLVREQKILRMIYYAGMTQVNIAKELGVTQARITQIKNKALGKMRKRMSREKGWK
jgi:RNA polymerase sigma factor (sigma-70 family)